MKITALLVVYENQYGAEAVRYLEFFTKFTFGKRIDRILTINNDASSRQEGQVAGNNEYGEFSGWDEGLRRLREEGDLKDDDIFIVANDSFFRNYPTNQLFFFREKIRKLPDKYMMGWVDALPIAMDMSCSNSCKYIRTNFFITNGITLNRLRHLNSITDKNDYLSSDANHLVTFQDDSQSAYRDLIEEWLIQNREMKYFDHKWYKASPLTADTRDALQFKALCIINEHLLTLRAIKSHIHIIGVNVQVSMSTRFIAKLFSSVLKHGFPNHIKKW